MDLRNNNAKNEVIAPHMLELFMKNLALKITFKYHVNIVVRKVAKLSGEANYGVVCETLENVRDLTIVELLYKVCEVTRIRFSVVDSPVYNQLGQIVLRVEQ